MRCLAALGVVAAIAVVLAEVDPWALTTNYDGEITIRCNNTKYQWELAKNITWKLPDKDGEGVALGWADATREVRGTKGEEMYVKMVKPFNSGIYTCLLHMDDGTIYMIKRGLNLGGPSVSDLWEKYQTNVMIGGIAAGSCLGFFIIACLVYKFRYKEPGTKFSDTGLQAYNNYKHSDVQHVYDNPSDVTEGEKHSNGASIGNTDDTKL